MITFNLQAALVGKPIVTRAGYEWKFGAYNPDAPDGQRLLGWTRCKAEGEWSANFWFDNGLSLSPGSNNYDLFIAPESTPAPVSKPADARAGYDRYSFAIPQMAIVNALSQFNDGMESPPIQSNNPNHPIGSLAGANSEQLTPGESQKAPPEPIPAEVPMEIWVNVYPSTGVIAYTEEMYCNHAQAIPFRIGNRAYHYILDEEG